MKRKLVKIGVIFAILLLGIGGARLLSPTDRDSWDKIQIGMTEKEVEEILGGPGLTWLEVMRNSHDFSPNGVHLVEADHNGNTGPDWHWLGRGGMISIAFDRHGQVRWKRFLGQSNFFDRVRDRLRW